MRTRHPHQTQGVTQRFHLSKKWFYLYGTRCFCATHQHHPLTTTPGTICFFAYMYIRPIIRRGLGSAER